MEGKFIGLVVASQNFHGDGHTPPVIHHQAWLAFLCGLCASVVNRVRYGLSNPFGNLTTVTVLSLLFGEVAASSGITSR
jgi:hypothetical protein